MNIASITGGITAAVCAFIAWNVAPQRPFMSVHEMEVVAGVNGLEVIAERTVHQERVVADWRVTIVPRLEDAPSCQTRSGPNEHQGWSAYEADQKRRRAFTLDLWVGDEGCDVRLLPGVYDMYVSWAPRDGGPTVNAHTQFEKGNSQ